MTNAFAVKGIKMEKEKTKKKELISPPMAAAGCVLFGFLNQVFP